MSIIARWKVLALLSLSTCAAACNREPLDVAPEVDLDRFQGQWHEIAHIPRPSQADCSGTIATYEKRSDGTLALVHECTLADGRYRGATLLARIPDAKTPAKMEVDYGGHVGDYWILETAPDYRYAVVGHPSRDALWLLSRDPKMAPADLEAVLDHARRSGFDTARLEFTKAGPIPRGDPAPAVAYGCSLSPAGDRAGGGAGSRASAALLVLCVLAWCRRRSEARCGQAAPSADRVVRFRGAGAPS